MDSSFHIDGIEVPMWLGVIANPFLKEESVEHPTTIAVDLAKSVFEVSVSKELLASVCESG